MDEVHGAGWAQLKNQDRLEGEFLDIYGPFVAMREHKMSQRKSKKIDEELTNF